MLSRRGFLGVAAGATASIAAGVRTASAQSGSGDSVFAHGVASGDPLADRIVLWTRVTPSADAVPGSGLGDAVDVDWVLATDSDLVTVVASGTETTTAAQDHTVHVDATGLEPGTAYWYRFSALGEASPTGQTKTAAAQGTAPPRVRFGIVSCAEYEYGFFGAYRHLSGCDDLDAVLHLGDYIYEFGLEYGRPPTAAATPGSSVGRTHVPPNECVTLADYRARYGQYRGDADAMAMHGRHPVIVMYDDHEVANDTWKAGAENHQPEEGDFAARAAVARQAWREWMPIRQVDPNDVEVVHRGFRFGDLAELWMLDERRYRDEQPDNAFFSYGSVDPAINDPNRTMLGTAQRDWLLAGLSTSDAAWKVLGNPVPLFPFVLGPALATMVSDVFAPLAGSLPPIPPPLTVDDWNGYRVEQQAIFDTIGSAGVDDVIVLTGDYHESFVAEIPVSVGDYQFERNSLAVEFIAPSVTSPGLGETLEGGGLPEASAVEAVFAANLTAGNPWVRYHEGRSNGFGVVDFTVERAQYDFWFVDDKLDSASPARVASSWEVPRGTPLADPAAGPLSDDCSVAAPTTSPAGAGKLARTGGVPIPVGAAVSVAALAAGARILQRRAEVQRADPPA